MTRTAEGGPVSRLKGMPLGRLAAGEISAHMATHTDSLDAAPTAYDMVTHKTDGRVRAAIRPGL
ncbi:hypothetical protein ACH3WN_16205 [Streptomyces albogriseolus]|uniref:hypothetical protein n=1 Tax=Streptomyces albogriseolus TaxID=1887 RepID=UPI0037A1FE5F